MATVNNWKYKLMSLFHRSGMNKNWQPCTEAQKDNLKRMYPGKFEYKEIKPPNPTPSMTQCETFEDTEQIDANNATKAEVVTKKKVKKAKK